MLNTETSEPMKPDWYTFQPAPLKGSFIEMVAGLFDPSPNVTLTSDS
jgi:hypothetical protein